MKPKHPSAKKPILKWEDMKEYPFVTYNEKDKVYHLLEEKLSEHGRMFQRLKKMKPFKQSSDIVNMTKPYQLLILMMAA